MADIGKPRPQFFRYVEKPERVGEAELARARPVYIADLPEGGATEPEVTLVMFNDALARIEELETKVAALEAAAE